MDQYFKEYRKKIKAKNKFGLHPSYKEEFSYQQKTKVVIYLFTKAAELIGLEIEDFDDTQILLKIPSKSYFSNTQGEIITIAETLPNQLEIKSTSNKGIWDFGVNYKNVKLLIHAYEKLTQGYSRQEFLEHEMKLERMYSMEEYNVPTELPSPTYLKNINNRLFYILLMLAKLPNLVCAVLLGSYVEYSKHLITLSMLSISGLLYINSLFHFKILEKTNFTKEKIINAILILFDLLFFYLPIITISYYFNEVNVGWWIISAALLTLFIMHSFIYSSYIAIYLHNYKSSLIPGEVTLFIYFHRTIKKLPETEIRRNLDAMGWKQKELVDLAFEITTTDRIRYQAE